MAMIFNEQGELLVKASRPHEQIYPQPGWVEHDAEEIWNNTLSVIEELAQQRDLDDWKDEHPTGYGNSKLRPCAL